MNFMAHQLTTDGTGELLCDAAENDKQITLAPHIINAFITGQRSATAKSKAIQSLEKDMKCVVMMCNGFN